jgi:hypothetical protein
VGGPEELVPITGDDAESIQDQQDQEEDEQDEEDEDEEDENKDENRDENEDEEDDGNHTLLLDRLSEVQRAMAELLFALFSQLPSGQPDKWFSPVLRFVPYLSRHHDGTYYPPGQITQIIAALTFIGRITMFWVMHREVCQNVGVLYTA